MKKLKLSEKSNEWLNLCLNSRCNYCRENCSVYDLTKMEFDSPRAKIELISDVLSGRANCKDVMRILDRCTGCKKCLYSCPHGVDTAKIIDEFKNLIKDSEFKKNKKKFVIKTSYPIRWVDEFIKNKNPYGVEKQESWDKEDVEIIFFPGCTALYNNKELIERTRLILDKLGIKCREANNCCYSPLKPYGFSSKEISELFSNDDKTGDKEIVVICAGCYDSLKNDHKKNVIHITDFLMKHINKLNLKSGKKARIAYHDPCKIGRYNKIYDSPRSILKAIKGVTIKEIENNKENSMCCGGGGALNRYNPELSAEMSKKIFERIQDADVIVTSCTFCKEQLSKNSKIPVKHIVELVAESMD